MQVVAKIYIFNLSEAKASELLENLEEIFSLERFYNYYHV